MSVKLKKIRRSTPQNPQQYKWYLVQERSGSVELSEIAKEISERSSLTYGDVQSVLRNLLETLPLYIRLGQTIHLEGFGSFHISVSSEGTENPADLTAHNVKNAKLIFTPSVEMKKALSGISFEIEREAPQTPAAAPASD